MSSRLQGKVVILTGAATGIGRACSLAIAKEGANVVLVGRRKSLLDDLSREIGSSALPLAADITLQRDITRVVEETVRRFGAISVLVNNAGVLHPGTAEQITEEQWDETFNINVRGLWLMSRAWQAAANSFDRNAEPLSVSRRRTVIPSLA